MEIRPCTEADLAVLNRRWPSPGVWAGHLRRQDSGEAAFLVAWLDEEPVGVGLLQWGGCVGDNTRAAFPDAVEVNHLQVRESHRGAGIGTGLISAAEELAKADGRRQVVLAVDADNPLARSLYLRLGYRPTGIVDTITYSYRDEAGHEQQATETSEALTKAL